VKLIVTIGLPGSGKSTYLARLGVNAISSDEMRRVIADDPHDQSINARVFSAVRYLIRQRIAAGRPVTYVDATHLTPWTRQPYVKLARRYGCRLEALFFDVPVEICIARNRARDRVVPEAAIRKMAQEMIPPSTEEGFEITRITMDG
jgi:predicted kinase